MEIAWINSYKNINCEGTADLTEPFTKYISDTIKQNTTIPEKSESGVYLATIDAGALPAVQFWKDSLAIGVSFVGPALFPWTLANSYATSISINLKSRGPNYTFIGYGDALIAAIEQATIDLNCDRVQNAFIIGIDIVKDNPTNPMCSYIELVNDKRSHALSMSNYFYGVEHMFSAAECLQFLISYLDTNQVDEAILDLPTIFTYPLTSQEKL
jgi:hypothetical protein